MKKTNNEEAHSLSEETLILFLHAASNGLGNLAKQQPEQKQFISSSIPTQRIL
ncbi:MAG TPA: hypothetical protein V6D07_01705 [Trichocoleus sp.]